MPRILLCLMLTVFLAPDNPEAPTAEKPLAPTPVSEEPLPIADPIVFLQKCLDRYEKQGIQGYMVTLHKQERLGGKLQPSEDIDVCFNEKPHQVLFKWQKGQRLAAAALYAQGRNNDKMLAKPSGLAGSLVKFVARDVDGPDAKQSGRYSLKEFGIKN